MYVAIYLASIIAANISAATFGASVTVLNAFLFIGLDLTLRDKLHDGHIWGESIRFDESGTPSRSVVIR